jgi:hypothetical protein
MSFDTTARQRLATGAEEQEMPACLPLVSFPGDERATEMQFEREAFTKVIIFNGGIEISQDEEACPHCDRIGGISVLFSASRAREVAAAMNKLADEIDQATANYLAGEGDE